MTKTETKPATCKAEGCIEPVAGKQQYCSGKCRTAHSRATVTPKPAPTVTIGGVTNPEPVTVSLDHYRANSSMYATRAEPDKLNWDGWMNPCQLKYNHLTANRVPIPGDWDFSETTTDA